MKKRIFLPLFGALACVGLSAQTSVVAVGSAAVAPENVCYLLPKTEIVVEVEMAQTLRKTGPFCKYAERYLGVRHVVTDDGCEWRLAAVRLHGRVVPDDEKRFAVAVNKKTTAYNIQTSEKGVILAVNQVVDVQKMPRKTRAKQPDCDTLMPFDMACLGEEALVASSVPKMAEMAAKQIYRIRENRANLLSGENEKLPDGAALAMMLQRLDEAEKELVALFVGRTMVCHQTTTMVLSPRSEQTDSVLCRISRYAGVVAADDLSGEPIYFSLSVDGQSLDFQQNNEQPKSCGLFYNVPTTATVTISDGQKTLAEQSLTMPQFGTVRCLPAALFDGQATKVQFTRFGGIESISK